MYSSVRRAWASLFLPLDRLFNRIFASEWNPLYRSGTLAVVFMLAATVTGVYLIFFFQLADPYGSVARLQDQVWAGRWIRAFHRYGSAGATICVAAHAIRMFAQGKSWGRRSLAWISGIFTLLLLGITSWSGYLLVWDQNAHALNTAWTGMVDGIGISASPLSQSFSGSTIRPQSSYFFMILFLHAVLPLALVFGIGLHTSRLARASWFPARRMALTILGLLLVVACLIPAPLGPAADLLHLPLKYRINLWDTVLVPFAVHRPIVAFGVLLGVLFFAISLPFWLRPARKKQPLPSNLDPLVCVGCGRCANDCPYEAIQMVPRLENPDEKLSTRFALVDPNRCVSCGVCAASCLVFTIGPPGRKGRDQQSTAEAFLSDLASQGVDTTQKTVILACRNQPNSLQRMQDFAAKDDDLAFYPIPCGGTLHPSVLERLAGSFKRVVMAACPPRNCTNKDGFLMLTERLDGKRVPPRFADPSLRSKIEILPMGEGEEEKIQDHVLGNRRRLRRAWNKILPWAGGLLLMSLLTITIPVQHNPNQAALRLSWRLTGQRIQHTRTRTPEELARMPIHMRTPEERVDEPVPFHLAVRVDGKTRVDHAVRSSGLRQDGPMYVYEQLPLLPGAHQVSVHFTPNHPQATHLKPLVYEGRLEFRPGQVLLLTVGTGGELVLHQSP